MDVYEIRIEGLSYLYNYKEHTATVKWSQYNRSVRNLTIPSTFSYNGIEVKVEGIDEFSFRKCQHLKSVHISEGITKISSHAFSFCPNLEEVIIPSTITFIDNWAFAYNQSLKNIHIPSNVKYIDPTAFVSCPNMRISVDSANPYYDSRNNCNAVIETATNTLYFANQNTHIPCSIVAIGEHAFNDCQHIKEISIPEGIKSLHFFAFSGENSSLKSITIPKSIEKVESPFAYNSSLKTIYWNATYCRESVYTTFIKHYAFEGCGATSFVFGSEVEHIPDSLCKNMKKLKNVIISPSVITIGDDAFSGCDNLKYALVPQHLLSRAKEVFGLNTGVRAYSTNGVDYETLLKTEKQNGHI